MITIVVVAGLGFLVLAALAVGILDTVRAVDRREVAAERREKWEARVLELHGGLLPTDGPDAEESTWDDSPWVDSTWDDD